MKAIKGTLITCDAAVKQLLLALNDEVRFVIEDLDETHVLVSTDRLEWVRARVDEELEKNAWTAES